MSRYYFLSLVFLAFLSSPPGIVHAQGTPWYVSALHFPKLRLKTDAHPVTIAIVDDGFRLDHAHIKDFLFRSERESPPNLRDDDGNGWADDSCGWDAADGDPDVSIPPGRESTFYHGTYLCGVITALLTHSFGPEASRYFKILPVKALADQSSRTYIEAGYLGLAYAIAQKPDIILCAWNGGTLGTEEARLLETARQNGIVVLASAGNFYSEKADPPASHPDVLAIAAVDASLKKTPVSNYGALVDLAGPGEQVLGADARSATGTRYEGGTSPAVAVCAAALALLKHLNPQANPQELLDALKNTAQPLDSLNLNYAGKLGSGLPNVEQALRFLEQSEGCCLTMNPLLPEGALSPKYLPKKTRDFLWQIAPAGTYQGIWFQLDALPKKSTLIQFFDNEKKTVGEIPFSGKSEKIYVPGNSAWVRFQSPKPPLETDFRLSYQVETIDSTRLFCRDIRYLENDSGSIRDGSKEALYANSCDCRWQIRGAEGTRIEIRFPEFDTQAKADFVYLFDGESAIPENIIAKFSGGDLPPVVRSRTNRVLVWFVADETIVGKGWTLEYRTIR